MKTSLIGQMSLIGEEPPPNCLPVEGQSVQTFLYDESGRLIRDTSDPCAARPTNYEFVWLDDQPLAVIDADPNLPSPQLVGHITSDHLHTPRAISNAAGTVTWTWAPVSGNSTSGGSNVFGERPAQATGAPFNTRAFNLRLPGQYLDAESGLHDNYFRDYEPGTGRYVQSDPIGLVDGIATYPYGHSSPLRRYDPFGLDSMAAGSFAGLCAPTMAPISALTISGGAFGVTRWGCVIGLASKYCIDQCRKCHTGDCE